LDTKFNRIIIQWGTHYFRDYGGQLNLPIAYTTKYSPVATHYTKTGNNTYVVRVNKVLLPTFQIYSTTQEFDTMWISIGY